ncbi:hypothetical protein EELLY_v1c03240 [Entomoplasma ellychniae]|uniref:Transmembrane protein n=1 Tax=Entomoplasma ellychniae TaxID=2114 RepID=A0A8E2QYK1_9MOLU|nr:hypothetical protein [Entomoplasma ellychniae]PPE04644.1 hypothetical protein EELLY_v1c03240 [Entomoplasma ellychniae]
MFLLVVFFAPIMISIIVLIAINFFILSKRNFEESKIYFVSVILLDAFITFWLLIWIGLIVLFLYEHEAFSLFYQYIIIITILYIVKALNIVFCYIQSKKIKVFEGNIIANSKVQIWLFLFLFIIPFANIIWIFRILFSMVSQEKNKETVNKV